MVIAAARAGGHGVGLDINPSLIRAATVRKCDPSLSSSSAHVNDSLVKSALLDVRLP